MPKVPPRLEDFPVPVKVIFILLVAFGCFLFVTVGWLFNRAPVAPAKLDTLNTGMSRDAVEAAIGKPTGAFQTNHVWAYSKPLGWSIVYVYFDENGRMQKYEYDR